jgi:hypothetical protein
MVTAIWLLVVACYYEHCIRIVNHCQGGHGTLSTRSLAAPACRLHAALQGCPAPLGRMRRIQPNTYTVRLLAASCSTAQGLPQIRPTQLGLQCQSKCGKGWTSSRGLDAVIRPCIEGTSREIYVRKCRKSDLSIIYI